MCYALAMDGYASLCGALVAIFPVCAVEGMAQEPPHCAPLDLAIERLDPPPTAYVDFCAREPGACELDGPPALEWSARFHEQLSAVNRAVNAEVRFTLDIGNSGLEESWDFPTSGFGDCEDHALEKRRRLIEAGLPSAALTCAIVMHETQFFLHTVLLAETSAGTLVLDDRYDKVTCWDELPYVFRLRERPDGMWSRFALP